MTDALEAARTGARAALLARRDARGAFVGRLSSSALSTATAAMALAMSRDPAHRTLAAGGHAWLCAHQNDDGGFGDTIGSPSNVSTTTLAWCSLAFADPDEPSVAAAVGRAEAWLVRDGGSLDPRGLAATIRGRYGKDRTFSVPILTTCALAGRLGEGGWRHVPALPFELAACPHAWFKWLRLPTVSYALPALIAIGQVRHHHRPTRNPLTRPLRALTRAATLRKLRAIQPASGGYLEAAPLTSFVAMALQSMGLTDHPVVEHGLRFLRETVRADGSWPIDTNLDTWLTTLAVQALGGMDAATRQWLLAQQYRQEHPYTHAAPGGWAWTDLTGGVPDADDTAGALLALHADDPTAHLDAARRGVTWLLDLTNRDGGVPTFCSGWANLPFDRSSPDITAHALRAWAAWRPRLDAATGARIDAAARAAVRYLGAAQREDGAWIPLWFGNQHDPRKENPLYGTARVLLAAAALDDGTLRAAGRRGAAWLVAQQRDDGGFGPAPSIEETALAVEGLARFWRALPPDDAARTDLAAAVRRGAAWLVARTARGFEPAPIGLYFAQLWYSEELYPLVFTVAALDAARGIARP